jgi:hypothetical protein
LPPNLYRQILYLIKDYDRIRNLWSEEPYAVPNTDGQPQETDIGDHNFSRTHQRLRLEEDIKAIEQSLLEIPKEYQDGVSNHLKYGVLFPDCGDRKTWYKYQSMYIYQIAKQLCKI